ncbi:hypothetical protein [Wolbachia endosymbiont (group E) of Neria commutata]|uniref:hypothetical protein n=1 Tax=Wolbachia endosymbiont (group E) of Neria commutata TaxID=3066149 RepID=UPI003132C4FC
MTEQFYNNGGGDSSIFQAKIREEDLAAEEKINEIIKAADKLVRDAVLQKQSHGQINQQVQSELDGLLDRVESCIEESDTENDEGILQKIYECLKNFFSTLGISVNEPGLENYLLKIKKERDKNWLFSIIKELCDKLRKLLSKVFKEDLSWDEALEKKIKELEEKLKAGGMSEEETREVLGELGMLQELKLKFQMALVSLVLTSFFTFLEIDLRAAQAQETSTQENKKIESKEPEVKQAKENAEGGIKVSEENKKELQPITLFNNPTRDTRAQKFKENKEKKPTIPFKPDLDLFNLLKNLKPELEKFIEPKQAEEKLKQAAVTAPTPPPAALQPPAPAKAPEVRPVQLTPANARHSRKEKTQIAKLTSANEGKVDNLCNDFLTQFTCAEEKIPNMNEQNVSKAESMNEKVRSELGEVNRVEQAMDINCGRVM